MFGETPLFENLDKKGGNRIDILKSQIHYDSKLLNDEQKKDIENVVLNNPEAFSVDESELGCSNSFTYEIRLKPEAKLHFVPSYKLSSLETDLLEHEVQKWQLLITLTGRCHSALSSCHNTRGG